MRANASRDVVSRSLTFMGSPFLPASQVTTTVALRLPSDGPDNTRTPLVSRGKKGCGRCCCSPRSLAPRLRSLQDLQPLPPRNVHVGNSPRTPPDGPHRRWADVPGRPSGPLFSLTITSSPQYEPLPLYPRAR